MPADDVGLPKGVVDRVAVIREMIRHEDALRAQRLGWLFTLDGFLFAALGFSWSAKGSSWLIFVLGLLGVVIGLSAVASMHISDKAIRTLKALVPKEPSQDSDALVRVAGLDSVEIPDCSTGLFLGRSCRGRS